MCDSSRPATRMSAQLYRIPVVRGCTRMGVAALALAAVATAPSAFAARRQAAVPAHGAAHGHALATTHAAAHARPAAATAGTGRNHVAAARMAAVADAPRHAGALRNSRTLSSRAAGRAHDVVVSASHGGARSRHSLPEAEAQEHYIPLSEASAHPAPPSPHTRHQANTHPVTLRAARDNAPVADVTATKVAELPAGLADRSAEDRVHAWYRAQASSSPAPLPTAGADPVANAAEVAVLGSPAPVAALPNIVARAETPAVVKAPPAEITRTVPPVPDAAHAAQAAAQTQSTADDDAAFAEASNIPSTAPTAREPLPFVHGDFRAAGLPTGVTQHAALAARPKTPAVVRIDPRGDAEVLASAANPAASRLGVKDVAAPLGQWPSALSQPSVVAAARKPKLDAVIANGTAAGALDDDASYTGTPATLQSVRAAKGDVSAARPAVLSGYDVELSGGPATQVKLFDEGGRLILLPPMKGSHEILVHQNQMAISDGLDRVENDGQLAEMHRLKLLVALPDTDAIFPNDRLPLNRRYARPWVVRFLNDMAQAHYQRFHTPLIVTSAVRTVAFQRHLVMVNGNAAPPTGDVASPHLYGQAVDLAKHGMTVAEIAWMRSYLTPVETAGKIDVEEEFQQACFHISVYRRYLGLPTPRNVPDPAPQRTLQLARASQPAPALHPFQRAKAALQRHRRLPTALLASGLR